MFNYCFNDLWLSPPTPDVANPPACKWACREITHNVKCSEMFFRLCDCRSTSRATPCHVLTWRRPHPGLPGRPSTSPTTAATTSSVSATRAKLASRIPACSRWAGRGSRCATAPATGPPAAPLTVSAEWKRQMVSFQLSQPLDVSVLSHSNVLSASLQASYWPPRLKPFPLSVCLLFIRSFLSFLPLQTFPLSVLRKLRERYLNQLSCL